MYVSRAQNPLVEQQFVPIVPFEKKALWAQIVVYQVHEEIVFFITFYAIVIFAL